MSHPTTDMQRQAFSNGNVFLSVYYPAGSSFVIGGLDAEIVSRAPTDLYIAHVTVKETMQRLGVGSLLVKSAVRGAMTLQPELTTCSAALINPVVVPMFQKIFGDSVHFQHAESGERLEPEGAMEMIERYQALEEQFSARKMEVPKALVDTVMASAEISAELVSGWPQPQFI